MEVDWGHFEEVVFRSASQVLRDFSAQHANEVFYGFFLDCNATYFEILGHLNTEELLREKANASKREYPDLYQKVSIEALIDELRWSGGDWGYFQLVNACGQDDAFDQLVAAMIRHFTLERRGSDTSVYENFLEMACRVAVRLERGNAFDGLLRTPGFR